MINRNINSSAETCTTKQNYCANLQKDQQNWFPIKNNNFDVCFINGFKYWVCVLGKHHHYYAIAGSDPKKANYLKAQIIYEGNKENAMNNGFQFFRERATSPSEYGNAPWKNQTPSKSQLDFIEKLRPKYELQNLTKGNVSNIMSFEFQAKKEIQKLLNIKL
jgi:hypothetical protein